MRCIDADVLEKKLDAMYSSATGDGPERGGFETGIFAAMLAVNGCPEVNPAVEEGQWELHKKGLRLYCSNCSADSPQNKPWAYCPYCGSRNTGP